MGISVACRKCDGCLKHRRNLWAARAVSEITLSRRTWFGTLTITPDWREWASHAARRRASVDGYSYDDLTELEQFRMKCEAIYPAIQLYFKRLRKKGARIRYLLVAERHKDGQPHFHLFVHEYTDTIAPKSLLEAQWSHGWSHWRLVDKEASAKAAWYVCKYLAKEIPTRVWNSTRYGQGVALKDAGAWRPAVWTKVAANAVTTVQKPCEDTTPPGSSVGPQSETGLKR